MTSIRMVADLAGVSTATVSNTLNRPEVVHPETRERVNDAIDRLGFIPNQHARQLNGLSSQVLALVVIDASNPFFTEVAHAVEEAASQSDHVVILSSSGGSVAKEHKLIRLLAGQRVAGILLTPADAAAFGPDWLSSLPVPVVLLDHPSPAGGCSVAVDDFHGGRLAADHLLDLGHRRIAFVGGRSAIRQHAERWAGAVEAVRARGLVPETVLERIRTPTIDIAAGLGAAEAVVDGSATGVLCANDVIAFGVYRGLSQRGIRVPEDVSIVGYDDIEVAADWIVPLTSVRQPTAEMGRVATRLLLEHSIGGPAHEHQQIVFQPTLIPRQSSMPRTIPTDR